MFAVREATFDDVEGIRDAFQAEYGRHYAHPEYLERESLARLVYADGSILLVAVDSRSGRIAGTASVVFSVGAYNDLVGEFGRLVVHPAFRGHGIGNQLMQGRLVRVKHRLHVGLVENRSAHSLSQRISTAHGFVPVGFNPMKLMLERRESVALFVRYFSNALALRRNNPRMIPEAASLANSALENCRLPADAIVDESAAPYPYDNDFTLDELTTEGYTSLLRIERGRIQSRDVFGPIRLHYGLFQLKARHSHYLIARRGSQVAGGIGFMVDHAEKAVRVFELISQSDAPIRFLLNSLTHKCRTSLRTEYLEIDVSAYAPRMQRTLLEMGYLPACYIPANVFHQVERLDAIKMAKLFVPLDATNMQLCDSVRPIAEEVLGRFRDNELSHLVSSTGLQTPLLRGLTREQRERILAVSSPRLFRGGESIYRQGDTDNALYLIVEGEATLESNGTSVASLYAGQCIGESSLIYSPAATRHSVNAIAKSALSTITFTAEDILRVIRLRPDIGVVIYRNLARDISTKLKGVDRKP